MERPDKTLRDGGMATHDDLPIPIGRPECQCLFEWWHSVGACCMCHTRGGGADPKVQAFIHRPFLVDTVQDARRECIARSGCPNEELCREHHTGLHMCLATRMHGDGTLGGMYHHPSANSRVDDRSCGRQEDIDAQDTALSQERLVNQSCSFPFVEKGYIDMWERRTNHVEPIVVDADQVDARLHSHRLRTPKEAGRMRATLLMLAHPVGREASSTRGETAWLSSRGRRVSHPAGRWRPAGERRYELLSTVRS